MRNQTAHSENAGLCLLVATLVGFCFVPIINASEKVSAELFFKDPRIVQVEMSPDGKTVLQEVNEDGRVFIEAILPQAKKSFVLSDLGEAEIGRFVWLGNQNFLFTLFNENLQAWQYVVVRMQIVDDAIVDPEFQLFREPGFLVDPVVEEDQWMLFYSNGELYRYPLHKGGNIDRHFKRKYRVDLDIPEKGLMLADNTHDVRFILGNMRDRGADPAEEAQSTSEDDNDASPETVHGIWYRAKGQEDWRQVAELDGEYWYIPIGFAADQRSIIMITDFERDTRALMRFDPEQGKFTETLFELEGIDLTSARLHTNGDLKVVTYLRNGSEEQVYFREASAETMEVLRNTVQGQNNTASILDSSVDGVWHLARVIGPAEDGRYLHINSKEMHGLVLGANRPWLDGLISHDVRVVEAQSKDGERLEGYLYIPTQADHVTKETFPLVVMPHGGPHGVRSTAGFDATSQYLAANGFAVLKVNYRGSGGFGKSFLEQGKGQVGTGIEDDVEALVSAAITNHPVDPNRICAYGGSYGGYSSLMLTIRNPERYRCAASFAGVTDLFLLFSASDWQHDESIVDLKKEWYGDPDAEPQSLRERSPVYLAEHIHNPVFLAQGGEDYRVDPEHYYRMQLVLDQFDKTYEDVFYPETGHGFDKAENAVDFHRRLLAFLQRYSNQTASSDGQDKIATTQTAVSQ